MKHLLLFTFLLAFVQANAQQLNESFEGTTFPPKDWQHILETGNTRGWIQLGTSTHSIDAAQDGTKFVEFESYSTSKNKTAFLITPYLDLTKGYTDLSFYSVVTPKSYGLHIDVSTDNGDSWMEDVYSISNTPGESEWTQHTVSLAAYDQHNKVLVRFRAASSWGSGQCSIALDNVSGPTLYIPDEAPDAATSPQPEEQATDIAITGELTWNTVAFAAGYKIAIGTNAEADNVVALTDLGQSSSYTLSAPLTYNTTYYWKVVPYNANGDCTNPTIWSFTTITDPTITSFPYQESFEGSSFPPAGWAISSDNTQYGWCSDNGTTKGPGNVTDGQLAAMAVTYSMKKNETATLTTPPLKLSQLQNPQLSFDWQCKGGTDPDPQLIVEWSTDGGISYEQLFSGSADGSADNWITAKTDLTGATDLTLLRFKVVSDYGSYNLFLDNIKVFEPASMQVEAITCEQPILTDAPIGGDNIEILCINIKTTGAKDKCILSSLNLSTSGSSSGAGIQRAAIYYTGQSPEFETTSQYGEISTPTGSFTISGTQALDEGNNYFWLAYDVDAKATEDALIDAQCLQTTVSEANYTPVTTAPDGHRILKKFINMPAGVSSCTVTDHLTFYDDGGKDAACSQGFEGTLTLLPSDPTKKIKIDWSSFEIFNTSSVGKNDIFSVYHGSAIAEEQLVGTYSIMPPSTTSMDANGALTIYFKVNTGLPKNGWAATVSEITPQNMVLASNTVEQPVTTHLSAGDKDQVIARIHLNTEHTLQPITIRQFDLSTNGCTSNNDIDKAKIYYTGSSDSFSTDNLFGEQSAPAGSFAITGSQPLTNGVNYFWLVYDVSTLAIEDHILDAEVTAFTTGSSTVTPTTVTPTGNRIIKNIYYMPLESNHTKTVYAPFTFVDDGGENSKYNFQAYSTVTFVPAASGEKVKINFEQFEVLYQATSYGTKATFNIFNGTGTAAANKIWQADETNCNNGPGGIITSTADDGSLTIQFVANAYTSTQTKAGWKARVWSDVPKPVQYSTVQVTQPEEIIQAGSSNQEILHVNLQLEGTQNPLTDIAFTFSPEGSSNTADIAAARLFYTGSSAAFNTDVQAGSVITSPNGEFTISHTGDFSEGNHHFWLAYDVTGNAQVENVLDARLIKTTISNHDYQPTDGNPTGYRTIKRLHQMTGGVYEITVNESPLQFYDDGGISANYTKEFDGTVTFVPETEGQMVRLEIHKLGISSLEDLYIYNGETTDEANLLLKADDDENISETDAAYIFKSTAPNGKLTVRFTSTQWSTPQFGWEAIVKTITPQPVAFSHVTATQLTGTALRNESNAKVLKMPIHFIGETTPAVIENLSFTTGNTTNRTDIKNARIFSSGTDSEFNPESAVLFGQLTGEMGSTFTIDGSLQVNEESTQNMWLAYDIDGNATNGNLIDATLQSIKINGTTHSLTNGDPEGSLTIAGGMSGMFIIGESATADYSSFTTAFEALAAQSIEGPVVLNVEDGVYVERPRLPHIKGASAQNTITVQAQNGNAANVVLVNHTSPLSGYNMPDDAVLYVEGADFVTFRNITIKTSQRNYDAVVMISNQSRDVTFDGCIIEAPVTNGDIDISGIKNKAENVAHHNNDRISIINCRFTGGEIGAQLGGTGYIALPKEKGHQLINNTFEQQTKKGIYLDNTGDVTISGNTILNNTTTYNDFAGIDAYRVSDASVFSNNFILLDLTKYCTGMECRPITASDGQQALIYNNVIILSQSVDNSFGLTLGGGSANTGIFNNTIWLQGTSGTSAAFNVTGASNNPPANVALKNNLLINQAGGKAVKLQVDSHINGLTCDYNNLYSSGTALVQSKDIELASLTDWQAIAGATHSLSESVVFYTASDAHLKEAGNLIAGIPMAQVASDKDGKPRHQSTPTLGAYEFTAPDLSAPLFTEGYPTVAGIQAYSMQLKAAITKNGKLWCVILPQNDQQPSFDQVKAGTNNQNIAVGDNFKKHASLTKEQVTTLNFDGLADNTAYAVWVAIEDNLGTPADALARVDFTTSFKPTEPSTFDEATTGSLSFEDGTAMFMNVTVTEGAGVNNSPKYGVVETGETATVSITNTTSGIMLDGFFCQSSTAFTFKGMRADGTYTDAITVPGYSRWEYASMRTLGKVIAIEIDATSAPVLIDDFSSLPLPLSIASIEALSINQGESIIIPAQTEGGVLPYSFQWTPAQTLDDATLSQPLATPNATCEYTVTVTDAWGSKNTQKMLVKVSSDKAQPATFEGLLDGPEKYYMGDANNMESFFYSGSFKFNNFYTPSYSYWSRFAYSNETSTVFDPDNHLTTQFRSAAGQGANNSDTYAVVYAFRDVPEVTLTNTTQGEVLSGCYITNNAWAVYSMENGDNVAGEPFKAGDWYKVTISGYDKDGSLTGTKEVYLADYRSSNPDDHYIQKQWKWVNLAELGTVQKLIFMVDGSRKGDQGLNTPGYFCIDELNGTKDEVPTSVPQHAEASISLYPNPTQGQLFIDLSQVDDASAIEVYSVTGQIIMRKDVIHEVEELDLSNQTQGLYLVRIITPDQNIVRKVYLK